MLGQIINIKFTLLVNLFWFHRSLDVSFDIFVSQANASAKAKFLNYYMISVPDFFLSNQSHQLIFELSAAPSDNLASLSYSMPAFSANLLGVFRNNNNTT